MALETTQASYTYSGVYGSYRLVNSGLVKAAAT